MCRTTPNSPSLATIEAGGRRYLARRVVNAAGAWAELVGRQAGASRVPLLAYRRHLYESRAFGRAAARWPFVWDLTRRLYFRPSARGLLLSPCDRDLFRPGSAGASRAESPDPRLRRVMAKKLRSFSNALASITIDSEKAGLRTMTPDGRFAVGEDPRARGFFWVAGLGGHGVTTCFSVGKLAADLIAGRRVDAALARALSPARFTKGKNAS